MANIVIIYGTTSGNTEMVVSKVAELLKDKGHQATLKRVELSQPQDLLKGDVTILASPTYGHGLLPEEMMVFIEQVKKEGQVKSRRFAVIGLGDPKYDPEHHIESATTLERFIKEEGGTLALPALRISRSPVLWLETRVKEWADELITVINE